MTHRETTDGRFIQVDSATWWDTTGVDLVDESVVDEYLDEHPHVGIVELTVRRANANYSSHLKPEDR
jgi:hypothetical protein